MVTVTLKTAIFEHPHTAVRIKDNIFSTLEEFNLSTKEIIAVTDNGANIVTALRLAKIQRLSCISHCLHLFLTSDISKNPLLLNPLKIIRIKLKTIYRTIQHKNDEIKKYFHVTQQMDFLKKFDEMMTQIELSEEGEGQYGQTMEFEKYCIPLMNYYH